MPPRRRTTGDGFSLLDMTDDIKDAATNLISALSKMGVDANQDMIFRGIQDLVTQAAMSSNYPMTASEPTRRGTFEPPYNMTADFLSASYERYHNGDREDKKKALEIVVEAFNLDDADTFMQGIVMMNSSSARGKQLQAEADAESSTEDGTTADDPEELSDDDIDAIIQDDSTVDNGEGDDGDQGEGSAEDNSSEDGDGSSEDPDDPETDTKSPMSPDAPAKPLTASDRVRRVLAAKMSSSGSHEDRKRAFKVLEEKR